MRFHIDDVAIRQAKTPHELTMVNLLLVNLLLGAAGVVLNIGVLGFLLPMLPSLLVIAFTVWRARVHQHRGPWFAAAHWRLALRRYRLLLVAYGVSLALVGLGWLLAQGNADPKLQDIMFTAFLRVAVVPMLLAVMVTAVLESGSIYQAGRGEVPDNLVARFPPPAGAKLRQVDASDLPAREDRFD